MSDTLWEPTPLSNVPEPNPCIKRYGYGPDGSICADCKFLTFSQYNRRYYKCQWRSVSASQSSDHRKKWRACRKYEVTP